MTLTDYQYISLNPIKSLLGIETNYHQQSLSTILTLNPIKSLLGIETRLSMLIIVMALIL